MLYVPPHFRDDDPAALWAFMAARGFATLVTLGGEGEGELDVTLLPLLVEAEPAPLGRLVGHLARANPQWRRLRPVVRALALFQAGDSYISPAWYPSKQAHGRVVPTWNYETVAAWGSLRLVEDAPGLLSIVTRLTERHEGAREAAGQGAAWAVSDAPPEFVQAQLKGIVGLELTIERLEGKRKLSQNRPAEDCAGVAAGLEREGGAAKAALLAALAAAERARDT